MVHPFARGLGVSPKTGGYRGLKRGAGFILPGDLGVSPKFNSPKIGGYKGVDYIMIGLLERSSRS